MNETVQTALQSNMRLDTWPVGSILVKDAFDGSSHEAVAAMEKREDGWYWAEWDANGTSLFSGKPKLCIQCHASGADGVRALALPRGP